MSFTYKNPGKKKYKPSLTGYKTRFMALAKEKGVEAQFVAAKTLTEAKKVLWGHKK
jgi:hypothetical protein